MKYGFTEIAVVPLRATPSEGGEMLSQVLFGECFEVLTIRNNWTRIRLFHDAYEGWVDTKIISFLDEVGYQNMCNTAVLVVQKPFIEVESESTGRFFLPAGVSLPGCDGKEFTLADKAFSICSENKLTNEISDPVEIARLYMNSPYLWGGRTPWGMDCSGLTQTVYRQLGIGIPRDANKQVNAGETVNLLYEAEPGDLAFFDDKNGNITHVGMIAGNAKIIHASGKVRIDNIDHNGIYNTERKLYTHSLRVIKRVRKPS